MYLFLYSSHRHFIFLHKGHYLNSHTHTTSLKGGDLLPGCSYVQKQNSTLTRAPLLLLNYLHKKSSIQIGVKTRSSLLLLLFSSTISLCNGIAAAAAAAAMQHQWEILIIDAQFGNTPLTSKHVYLTLKKVPQRFRFFYLTELILNLYTSPAFTSTVALKYSIITLFHRFVFRRNSRIRMRWAFVRHLKISVKTIQPASSVSKKHINSVSSGNQLIGYFT